MGWSMPMSSKHTQLLVNWQLCSPCYYDCSCCGDSSPEVSALLDRQQLLALADCILRQPVQQIRVVFSGAEPAMHPWLTDIAFHLLSGGKNIHVRINSNGSRDLCYFKDLIAGVDPADLSFGLHIHPGQAKLPDVLMLIAMLKEAGHAVDVHLYNDASQLLQNFKTGLAAFQARVGLNWRIIDERSPLVCLDGQPDCIIDPQGCMDPPLIAFCVPSPAHPNTDAKPQILFEPHIFDISIVVFAASADDAPWLNALLAENAGVEIIISAGDRARVDALARFAELQKRSVRLVHTTASDAPPSLADYLCVASGRYVIIAVPAMRPLPGALPQALAAMQKIQADMGIFGVAPAVYSGKAALRAALEDGSLQPLSGHVVYDRGFLTEKVNLNMDPGAFLAECVALSAIPKASTILASELSIWRKLEEGACKCRLDELDNLREQASACARELNISALDGVFTSFCRDHADIFRHLDVDIQRDRLTLVSIFSHPGFLTLLLARYAQAHCRRIGSCLAIHAEDLDWRKPVIKKAPVWRAHGDADIPHASPPLLSVILPNYNKSPWLEACLDSICNQDMANFELIIVDDHSDDGSWQILAQRATVDSRIRLFRMEATSLQGACRNLGLKKARSDYVIFVDSDDRCLPGFFSSALRLIKSANADMVIFSHCQNAENGVQLWEQTMPDAVWSGVDARRAWLMGGIEPAPWAKIFNRAFLLRNKCSFPEGVYHQDVAFFLAALQAANVITCTRQKGYASTRTAGSASRPKSASYLRIHSAYALYGTLGRALDREFNWHAPLPEGMDPAHHILWNLENILLEQVQAFLLAGKDMPITDSDRDSLATNTYFLFALLKGYKDCLTQLKIAGLDNPPELMDAEMLLKPIIVVAFNGDGGQAALYLDAVPKWARNFLELVPVSDWPNEENGVDPRNPGVFLFVSMADALPKWHELLEAGALLRQRPEMPALLFCRDEGAASAGLTDFTDDAFDLNLITGCLVNFSSSCPALRSAPERAAWLLEMRGKCDVFWQSKVAARAIVQSQWTLNQAFAALARLCAFFFASHDPAWKSREDAAIKSFCQRYIKPVLPAGYVDVADMPIAACARALPHLAQSVASTAMPEANPAPAQLMAPGAGERTFPRLSILIYVNADDCRLARTLESIVAQNYGYLEILAVDDSGGDAGLFRSLRAASINMPQLRLLRSPWPCGFAGAMNFALESALGDWIMFLPVGASLPPEALRHLAPFLARQEADIIAEYLDPSHFGLKSRMRQMSRIWGKLYRSKFLRLHNIRLASCDLDLAAFALVAHARAAAEVKTDFAFCIGDNSADLAAGSPLAVEANVLLDLIEAISVLAPNRDAACMLLDAAQVSARIQHLGAAMKMEKKSAESAHKLFDSLAPSPLFWTALLNVYQRM